MTDDKFTELVNLYLDKEISERGLAELKAELAADDERRAVFRERCRLHQAMRLALNPQGAKRRSESKRRSRSRQAAGAKRVSSRLSSRSDLETSGRSPKPVSTRVAEARGNVNFPGWVSGVGLAACFALGFALLEPVFRDTTDLASQPELKGVKAEELVENDPLDSIGSSELRRFASIQEQRAANRRASIAAQLRLMGLRPEHTPEEKDLRSVDVNATHRAIPKRSQAELLAEVQKMSPMPATRILRVEPMELESPAVWSGGFQTSLATFK